MMLRGPRWPRSAPQPLRRGQGLLELVLAMPFMLVMLLGMTDLARVQLWRLSLAGSAQAGALYASQSIDHATDTDGITNRVLAELTSLPATNPSGTATVPGVTVSAPTSDGYGVQQVTVTVSLELPAILNVPWLPHTWNLSTSAVGRIST